MANDRLRKFTSIFVKTEDEPVQETTNNTQFQAKFNPTQAPAPVMKVDTDTPDQAYLDHLYKYMEDQNIPGPDYFEYANTLHEMSQMGAIPEESLYKLAYVGLKSQNVTPDQLVQTAGKYIELFAKHKKEFDQYLSNEGSAQLTSKTQEIDVLQNANSGAEAKIAELTQQIQSLQQQMVTNTQKISENKNFIANENQAINAKKAKFEKAYQIVVDKVNGDIQKIKTYVKA